MPKAQNFVPVPIKRAVTMPDAKLPFWSKSADEICAALRCGRDGWSRIGGLGRLAQYGANSDAPPRRAGALRAILRRLLEPLSLILLAAGIVSVVTGDAIGGSIIVMILAFSIGLDTLQEGHAARRRRCCADRWRSRPRSSATASSPVAVDEVVPGDVLRVRAGDIIPADALVLESAAFTAGEAALTGEPYPVEKRPGLVTPQAPARPPTRCFAAPVAQTGEAIALVVGTGRATVFGAAASALAEAQRPSPFQRDLHEFGLADRAADARARCVVVLATRMLFGRPVLESLMFAVALAVGLTPELLPMITTVTLSRGALRMARAR